MNFVIAVCHSTLYSMHVSELNELHVHAVNPDALLRATQAHTCTKKACTAYAYIVADWVQASARHDFSEPYLSFFLLSTHLSM